MKKYITTQKFSNALLRGSWLMGLTFVIALVMNVVATAQPVLIAPDSVITQPQSLTLAWTATDNAATYTVQVSEGNDDFDTILLEESGITDTTLLVTDLSVNKTYHWRVNVTDSSNNTSDFSTPWYFTTWDSTPDSPPTVQLGTSGDYVILAKAAISTVPQSAITGDVGVSPQAESYITGFDLTDATGYATSTQVTGLVYAADMADPTPINLTTAIGNMETAYNDASGRITPDFSELHVGDLGGKLLIPGLYKWSTTVSAPTSFEISGGENEVWIFQIAGDLVMASDINITLSGGAQPQNIFWVVAGEVSIGTNAHFEGIILSKTAIHLKTGASMNGRLLAQTAVTLDANTITEPTSKTTNIDEDKMIPTKLSLDQNYPNPFNPTTQINFELPEQAVVRLAVYDMLGREVAVLVSESRSAGQHQVTWNAHSASSGMYVYRLTSNGQVLMGKMTLIK
ncbi:MAG: ice-binding family protein [Balneolales bacterium]